MGASSGRVGPRLISAVVVVALVATAVALTGSPVSAAPVDSITRVATGIDRPEGIVHGPDGNAWFTNPGNDTIGRSTPIGVVTLFPGTGIDEPTDIVVGPDGALWFTNVGNGSVGRISTTGVVTNFQIPDLAQLNGIATGADGNLWVAESTFDTIVRITPAGVMTAFPSGTTSPGAIVAGPDGNLWFTSKDDSKIVEMATTGAVVSTYTGLSITGPGAITTGPDGNLWFVNETTAGFGRITTSGTATAFASACMSPASAITSGTDGKLWFAVAANIGRITTDGFVTFVVGPAGSPVPTRIGGIATAAGGNLWFTGEGSLGMVTPAQTFTRFNGTSLASPRAIVGGPDGNLWFTNQASDSVIRMTPAGGYTSFSSLGTIENPEDIAAGPDGNLWFTNAGNTKIGRITPAGVVTGFNLPPQTSGRNITSGPDGNLWFTASGATSAIGRITTAGVVTMFTDPGIVSPRDITAGPDGNLWFTNTVVHSIGRITPTGTVTTFTSPSGEIGAPSGITTGPDGNLWYVNGGGSIGRISTNGFAFKVSGAGGTFDDEEIITGPDGALWYTRSLDDSVGRITVDGAITNHADPSLGDSPNGIGIGGDGNLFVTGKNSVIAKVALTRTTPVASGFVAATPGYREATVRWTQPSYTGGSPITGYTVTSNPGNKTCTTTGAQSCVVGGLTNGLAYTFTVTATNAQGTGPASAPSASVTLFQGATFHPMTPVRALDSRTSLGGWNGKLTAGSPKAIAVAGAHGIPSTATAVVMNVTVVESDSASFLTVYPNLAPLPNASNLNFAKSQIVPNLVTVKIGNIGAVQFATAVGSTHVVADIVGYYDDGNGAGGLFNPMAPVRLLDSHGPTGGWNGKLAAGTPRDLSVRKPGNPDGVPSDATAVIANVTVTQADAESFLSVWPSGLTQPTVSNLNFVPGQNVPNLVTIGIGSNGSIKLANAVGSVHVVVDVVGYFRPGTGARFFGMAPNRVLDSRFGTGLTGPWSAQTSRTLAISGAPGTNVPSAAQGVVANLTVVEGTAESLLTVYPGNVTRPNTSNLNFVKDQIVPNLVAVALAPDGTVRIFNDQGSVHVVADVVGFFAP